MERGGNGSGFLEIDTSDVGTRECFVLCVWCGGAFMLKVYVCFYLLESVMEILNLELFWRVW